jgi:hypothetical protein
MQMQMAIKGSYSPIAYGITEHYLSISIKLFYLFLFVFKNNQLLKNII